MSEFFGAVSFSINEAVSLSTKEPNKGRPPVSTGHLANVRASLQEFEGKINKIVSRNTLQQIQNKELALENMFHMLEPGGEAGILFYLSSLSTPWLQKIASSRWKKYHAKWNAHTANKSMNRQENVKSLLLTTSVMECSYCQQKYESARELSIHTFLHSGCDEQPYPVFQMRVVKNSKNRILDRTIDGKFDFPVVKQLKWKINATEVSKGNSSEVQKGNLNVILCDQENTVELRPTKTDSGYYSGESTGSQRTIESEKRKVRK
ncbi:hypothetical protein NPIL_394211 [Nephila pilipes]|uniref:C2H2-type domain-containing protein n=1 Tax=Nephila pilipes TaxID=299642 RepID=A0A8X6NVZ3_NEPPI|nr:hypothetical protein NPIL_394211 [Nephila pilipes]